MHAKRFSKRTKSQLVGYFETEYKDPAFDYIFFKNDDIDLMASGIDCIALDRRKGIALLPGSRPEHLQVALPIMLNMANDRDDVTVILSPFALDSDVSYFKALYPTVNFHRLIDTNDLAHFKYALTIPGTNTMQLAYLNIPYVMIFPTHESNILRMTGLIGLLLLIPILGAVLKFLVLNLSVRKNKIYSLPNRQFKSHVCPEIIGRFKIDEAKSQFLTFINDDDQYVKIIEQFKTLHKPKDPLLELILWLASN